MCSNSFSYFEFIVVLLISAVRYPLLYWRYWTGVNECLSIECLSNINTRFFNN
jgi:hypothetical protein